ncbi:MAG: cell envelope biogenesis protein TolA [Betaproteobacteria bacterium]
MNMQKKGLKMALMGALMSLAFGHTAFADDMAKDTKKAAKAHKERVVDQAEADYKAAKAACKEKSGNERDVCMKEAKGNYKTAKAEAKAQKKSTDAKAEAGEEKREAAYKTAKEKCDAMSGDAKDACIADVKAKYPH